MGRKKDSLVILISPRKEATLRAVLLLAGIYAEYAGKCQLRAL
jgi:hypothetical protein